MASVTSSLPKRSRNAVLTAFNVPASAMPPLIRKYRARYGAGGDHEGRPQIVLLQDDVDALGIALTVELGPGAACGQKVRGLGAAFLGHRPTT